MTGKMDFHEKIGATKFGGCDSVTLSRDVRDLKALFITP